MTTKRLALGGAIAALLLFGLACSSALDSGDAAVESESLTAGGIPLSNVDELGGPDFGDNTLVAGDGVSGELAYRSEADASEPPSVAVQLQGVLDRKIIQSTSVDLEVEEVGRPFQDIIRIAETAGGFVSSSSFSKVDDRQIADLTIRVPAEGYQAVLAQVRGLGDVTQEGSEANDVTEEYTDLQARLRTLEATEVRYLELLGRAETINDILVVQDRLDSVRGQIEQVQGRINLLEHLTDLGTITVHLRPAELDVAPPTDSGTNPLEAASEAWATSLDALNILAAGALVAVVFSWWLVPPAAALVIGARWLLGRRTKATQTSLA